MQSLGHFGRILKTTFFLLPRFLIVAFLGLLLLIIENWVPAWKTFFHDIAIALLAIGVTAPLSAYFLHTQVGQYLSIIKASAEAGIIDLFPQREGNPAAIAAIRAAIEEERDEILIAGIGLADFFVNDPARRPFFNVIASKIPHLRTGSSILLLDPDSQVCNDRSQIEGPGHRTKNEITESIEGIQVLMGKSPGKIELHTYDFPPIAFILVTSNCAFVEQYHFGHPGTHQGGCIGRRVPMSQVRKDSPSYAYMRAHFENIWNYKSVPIPFV